jgi:tetratricopeptide (TPR) repeat protein
MDRIRVLAVAVLLVVGWAAGPAGQTAPPTLPALLDWYAAGRFDEAVGAVAATRDAGLAFRERWRTEGSQWIDAHLETKAHRLLTAAAFALETEHLRAERGEWSLPTAGTCPGLDRQSMQFAGSRCVLDWARMLFVERGEPDETEHAWWLALSALAGGVRDWGTLYRPPLGPSTPARGWLVEGVRRFPDDPRLLLERAIALAARFTVTTDGGRLVPTGMITIVNVPGLQPTALRTRSDGRELAVEALTALAGDPVVGPEARLRLGYLWWVLGEGDKGRPELIGAADATTDRHLKYLAQFLLGWTAMTAGRPEDALAPLRSALATRPNSQSAALALAALELQRGEAALAHEIAESSLAGRPTDDDPWRLFLYGHHSGLPSLIAELRRKVRP